MKNRPYIIFIAAIVSLGGFLFGFDAAVISGVNSFITAEFNLTSLQLGTVVASVTISSAAAMLAAGAISDAVGRKNVLIVVALLYSISAIFSALAPSYEILIVARLIGGIAFGAALVLVPVYIAELVPANIRGGMVSINQLAIVVGFSAAYFSNYFFLKLSTGGSELAINWQLEENIWRWMLGIEAIPALIYFLALWVIPRSPRWLVMNGQTEKARTILNKINAKEETEGILDDIQTSLHLEEATEKETFFTRLKKLFDGKYRMILIVALIVGVAQMSVGINAVFFYATNIFELTGIGKDASFAQSVWVGIINVLFTFVAILLIDKLGRRPLLLAGLLGIALSLLLVAYGFNKATYTLTAEKVEVLEIELDKTKLSPLIGVTYSNDVAFGKAIVETLGRADAALHKAALIKSAGDLDPVLLLVGILFFVACFAFSLGPVMWVLFSEIFPNSIRGIAVSAVGFVNSMTSWVVVQFFPWQLENMGSAVTFLIFAIFAIVAFLLLLKLLPETKNKTLEELEAELAP